MAVYLKPVVGNAWKGTAGGTHSEFGHMEAGKFYRFAATVDTYVLQGAAPTATAGDGSEICPAGAFVYFAGSDGAQVSVLKAGTNSGDCTLQEVQMFW